MNSTNAQVRKASLDEGSQRLIAMMHRIGFGRIESLSVSAGRPVFDPPPRVIREVRLGAESSSPKRVGDADFAVKSAVVDLLAELAVVGVATVAIEVRHGLPARLIVEEVTHG
ncbi:MAG: hypothetical protein IT438_06670 [Phycisphaerales bacterium]|nr:hypothetical protein [Phycisphaerales bacterium]